MPRASSSSLPVGRRTPAPSPTRDAESPEVQYAQIPVIAHRTAGRQVPHDWPHRYLTHLAQHGTGWLAAKQAGVAYKTVQRLRDADDAFREHDEDARREHAESLEQNLNRIAEGSDMPAVTANIVRLKKLDPVGYVEKNLTMSVELSGDLDSAAGKRLLTAMLGTVTPATQQALVMDQRDGVLPGPDAPTVTRGLPQPDAVHDASPQA